MFNICKLLQKNTSIKQEETLRLIKDIEESHDKVLKSIEQFQNHQERVLSEILSLDKKIDAIIEEKEWIGDLITLLLLQLPHGENSLGFR